MKRYLKRGAAALLALALLLGLTACGKDDNDAQQLSGTIYLPKFVDFELDVDYISSGCSDGTYVYILGETSQAVLIGADGTKIRPMTDEEVEKFYTDNPEGTSDGSYISYESENKIYRVSLDGSEVEPLENFAPSTIPEGSEGSVYISGLTSGADGTLWVTEEIYTYNFDLPADFNPEEDDKWEYQTGSTDTTLRRQLDSTGNEISRVDTSGLREAVGASEEDYLGNSVMDGEGNLYVTVESYKDNVSSLRVAVLDKNMQMLFTLKQDNNTWGQLAALGDGTVGFYGHVAERGQVMRIIDREAKDWGKEYELPGNVNNLYPGSEDYLFYYDNGDSLYGFDPNAGEKGEGKKILSWSSADINQSNIQFFTFLADGRILAMTREWRGEGGPKVELAILTETDASVLADKTILTYACMYLDYDVREKIIDFNKSNTKYRIEIKDYSEYITGDDYEAGLTKLNTEILAGNIPDILATSQLPLQQYGAKDLLEDLWPWIEQDPELGREALMENVFKAAEQEGKLYQIFSDFSVRTVVGATSVVGDRNSWTLAEMQEALATMPEGCQFFSEGNTKEGMLSSVLSLNLDHYVNWETGKCSFNSDDFKAMLEFCNTFPLEYDHENIDWEEYEDEPTRIAAGKQMLMELYLSELQGLQMYEAIFGGDISFVGYPKEDGSVGSSFNIGSGMAMSSTCKDKEGAWSFMRQLLLPVDEDNRHYFSGMFSTNKAEFEKGMEKAMTPEYQLDENGNKVLDENGEPIQISQGGWGFGDVMVDIYAVPQRHYDQFMALYNSIDSVYTYDEKIFGIVKESVMGYFNGDKDVATAANEIQSRVELYVNENR